MLMKEYVKIHDAIIIVMILQASGLGEGVGVVGGGRRRRRWWTVLMCGCTGRSNIVMPETVT